MPTWLIVVAAVIMALPFGWGLGVAVAAAIAGPEFGQLPALTVPVALVGSVVFALSPVATPRVRLAIMAGGTLVFALLAALIP
jgi:hypothetical protein